VRKIVVGWLAVPGWGGRGSQQVLHRVGRRGGCQHPPNDHHAGCGHPRPSQLRRVGGILARQRDRAVRDGINGVAKHVATSAPLPPQWTNAHVIDSDLVEFARA
jgi:hypothetical protein